MKRCRLLAMSTTLPVHVSGNSERSEVRWHILTAVAIQLVRAFIVTRIDYCIRLLLDLPDCQLARLESILNAAARLVRWHDHVTSQFRDKLHWLWVPKHIMFKRCLLTFQVLHDPFCLEYLATFFRRMVWNDQRLHLRSSIRIQLYVLPLSKTVKLGERSFSCGNPLLWNALPDSVSSVTSFGDFASKLETYLFNISFPCSL